jgi:ATP-binding cassette subfamily G (WHITE) protein 5 (sterolin 1)
MFLVIWTCYTMAKQQTFASMLTLKSKSFAIAFLAAGHGLQITLGSGAVRCIRALPDWQYYLSFITQTRYAGAFLNEQIFSQKSGPMRSVNGSSCEMNNFLTGCRYLNGTHYLTDRYYTNTIDRDDINLYLNFGICFAFPVVAYLFTLIVYALPLPTLVKQKFRD